MNNNNFFYNQRNSEGSLMKFSTHSFSHEISKKILKLVLKSKIIKLLCEKFPKEYVEGYFYKMIFQQVLPLCSQIIIHEQKEKSDEKFIIEGGLSLSGQVTDYDLQVFVFDNLEQKYRDNFSLKFRENSFIEKLKLKNLLLKIYHWSLRLRKIFNKKKTMQNKKINCIAINYRQGLSFEGRSDFFWLYKSKNDLSNVILYVERPYFLRARNEPKMIKNLQKERKLRFIKIWEFNQTKEGSFNKIKKDFYKLSDNGFLDKILIKKSEQFIEKIEFWKNFFEQYNVKVHMDYNERSLDTIPKQVALYLVNGCSVGKQRSFYVSGKNLHESKQHFYFPNDIFCSWGGKYNVEDYKQKVSLKHEFKPHTLLNTGYPYSYVTEEVKLKVKKIGEKLKNNGARFNLLLLDNAIGINRSYVEQVMSYEFTREFYEAFFKWIIEDQEIGLIIKPKKKNHYKKIPNLQQYLKESLNTGRCHVVENAERTIPWHYSTITNMVVAVSVDTLPSALFDCIFNNKNCRGVYYDYGNCFNNENYFYSYLKNKTSFFDINEMLIKLKKYKSNPLKNNEIGLWPENYTKEFASIIDGRGHQRIGEYLNKLLECYNLGLEKSEAIKTANENYSKKWGQENILNFS